MRNDPATVVAQTLKRLYPHNPDVVLGREARTIVAALRDAGIVLLVKAGPECNVCDRTLPDHALTCPRKPDRFGMSSKVVDL